MLQKTEMTSMHGLDYANTALLLDVDDCFVPSTVRKLDVRQRRILWNLHDITGGAVILTTNSDMRSVDSMLPGFPCVSEHGSLYRLTANETPNNIAPSLDVRQITSRAFALAADMGLSTTTKAEELHKATPSLKIERKQASVALVFGKHSCYGEHAKDIVERLHDEFNLAGTHCVHVGTDAVEIAAKGFAKVNALDVIMEHVNFRDRRPVVFGDSGPDRDMMQRAFDNYSGLGVCVGNKIEDGAFVAMRVNDINGTWDCLEMIRNNFVAGKSKRYGRAIH